MKAGSRAGLAVFGLLFLGAAIGVGADHLWLAYRMHQPARQEASHEESLTGMLSTLHLSESQHEAISAILQRYHATVERQVATVHETLLTVMDSARLEIEALLNPEQLTAFRDWIGAEYERLDPHSIIPR